MIVNNLVINNKLKLLNNSSLKSSKNLNGTAAMAANDENGNKLVKSDAIVPSEQYNKLKDINNILDMRNVINNTSYEEKSNPYLLLVLNIDNKVTTAKILNTNNTLSTPNFYSAELVDLLIPNSDIACYGNGKVVILPCVGITTLAVYSEDGINWQTVTFPTNHVFNVCYGNDKFVAVTNETNDVYYSYDGITWKTTSIPSSDNCFWCTVCYSNGKFVAAGNTSSIAAIAYSIDGINWTLCANADSVAGYNWYSICYGNGKFILVNDDNIINSGKEANTIMAVSSDGITWKKLDTGITASYYKIIYGGGRFYALSRRYVNSIGAYRSAITSSKDGYTWTNSYYINNQDSKLPNDMVYVGERINDDGTTSQVIYCKSYTYVYAFYYDNDGNCTGWYYCSLKKQYPDTTYDIDKMILLPAK